MKTLTIKIFMTIVLVGMAASCTTNNGDIGPLWGRWKVETMECNGEQIADYKGNIFFSFQNSVFMVLRVNENIGQSGQYGVWSDEGDGMLVISFPDERYKPFEELHFSQERNVLTYDKVDSKGFALTSHAPDGNTYIYHLVKWK
ncbi:MAG: lipocalin-like domain-containing protein [Muribaculaceae bacterium]